MNFKSFQIPEIVYSDLGKTCLINLSDEDQTCDLAGLTSVNLINSDSVTKIYLISLSMSTWVRLPHPINIEDHDKWKAS
jgi:hypothetical protein